MSKSKERDLKSLLKGVRTALEDYAAESSDASEWFELAGAVLDRFAEAMTRELAVLGTLDYAFCVKRFSDGSSALLMGSIATPQQTVLRVDKDGYVRRYMTDGSSVSLDMSDGLKEILHEALVFAEVPYKERAGLVGRVLDALEKEG